MKLIKQKPENNTRNDRHHKNKIFIADSLRSTNAPY
jgi:hypothetical protein